MAAADDIPGGCDDDLAPYAVADSVDTVERGTTYPVPPIEVTAQEQVQDMNAPPNTDPVSAHSDSDVLHWLTNDTRDERFIDNIFAELCPAPASGRSLVGHVIRAPSLVWGS